MRQVVGAAIVRDARVLACRRTTGPDAGRWELPGGKVDDGESPEDALVREIAEELGLAVAVERWLDGVAPIREGLELRVALVSCGSEEPRPTEHDELRWLSAGQLDDVDWCEPDRPFLARLSGILDA